MKKGGFTLVELLAVIVILAIILAIAIPSISGIIDGTTRSAFESDAKMVLKTIDYKLLEDSSFNPSEVDETNIKDKLNLDDSNYQKIEVSILSGKSYIVIQGKNKWNGLVAYGTYQNIQVVNSDDYVDVINHLGYDSTKGVNEPKLAEGMTPIKWNGTTWVNTTASDTDWYNYTTADKKWANAKTADGSMWVWIPRYIYKISSGWHSSTTGTIDIQFSKGIDDNWNKDEIENINLDQSAEASKGTWTNHPAFTFGDTELTGIWVSKFEAGGTTSAIDFKPNVTSLRGISIDTMFTVSRNMETNSVYGWGTTGTGIDTHLMKNVEWGAVAYLSKSNYGQGTNEIWINNSQAYTTGCAGNAVSAFAYNGCQNTYETTNGVKASTTGNTYGIYDMSGGSWEYVAAYVNNANGNLGQGSTITGAAAQYKDVYTVGATDDQATNYGLTVNFKGDAVYETSNNINDPYSWFGDYSYMPNTDTPWFLRGGYFLSGSIAGAFNFDYDWGGAYSDIGFRPVLAVNAGL